jgi:hypothetical protein
MATDEERLAELKAQRAELVRKRAERLAAGAAKAQIEAEERELAVQRAIDEAELVHGDLGHRLLRVDARHPDGTVVGSVLVKPPAPMIYRRFRNTFPELKGVKKDEALEQLWRPSVVWPDAAAVDRLLEEFPRLGDQLSDAVALLAGAKEEEVAGKS